MALQYFASIVERLFIDAEEYLDSGDRKNADFYDILNYKLYNLTLDWDKFVEQSDEIFQNNVDYDEYKEKLLIRLNNIQSTGCEVLSKANCVTPKDYARVLFADYEDDDEDHLVGEEYQSIMKQFMLSRIKGTLHDVQQYLKAEKGPDYYNTLKHKINRFQEIPPNIKDLKNEHIYVNPVSEESRQKLWDWYIEVDRELRIVTGKANLVLPQQFGRVWEIKEFMHY